MSDDHDGFEPPMPPPDWGRYQVRSRAIDSTGAGHTALGDPNRWGGNVTALLNTNVPAESVQFLRAQTQDTYGRLWALTGTVDMTAARWVPGVEPLVWLVITQGVGQTTVSQNFDLVGLANAGIAAGAYARSFDVVTQRDRRAFAIIGGVIGQNWNARLFIFTTQPAIVDDPVNVNVIATPLAAGTGL